MYCHLFSHLWQVYVQLHLILRRSPYFRVAHNVRVSYLHQVQFELLNQDCLDARMRLQCKFFVEKIGTNQWMWLIGLVMYMRYNFDIIIDFILCMIYRISGLNAVKFYFIIYYFLPAKHQRLVTRATTSRATIISTKRATTEIPIIGTIPSPEPKYKGK